MLNNVGDSPSARFTPTDGPPRARTLSTAQTRRSIAPAALRVWWHTLLFLLHGGPRTLARLSHGGNSDALPTRLRTRGLAVVTSASARRSRAILVFDFASTSSRGTCSDPSSRTAAFLLLVLSISPSSAVHESNTICEPLPYFFGPSTMPTMFFHRRLRSIP